MRVHTVLVCGGRDFCNKSVLYDRLDEYHYYDPIILLVHGDARGADTLAKLWAIDRSVQHKPEPAQWDDLSHPMAIVKINRRGQKYNAMAGPIRNQKMLDENKIDAVIAFPGGSGTRDMCQRANNAGFVVLYPPV